MTKFLQSIGTVEWVILGAFGFLVIAYWIMTAREHAQLRKHGRSKSAKRSREPDPPGLIVRLIMQGKMKGILTTAFAIAIFGMIGYGLAVMTIETHRQSAADEVVRQKLARIRSPMTKMAMKAQEIVDSLSESQRKQAQAAPLGFPRGVKILIWDTDTNNFGLGQVRLDEELQPTGEEERLAVLLLGPMFTKGAGRYSNGAIAKNTCRDCTLVLIPEGSYAIYKEVVTGKPPEKVHGRRNEVVAFESHGYIVDFIKAH